ncbi:TetR/AcrR family transcriptional regulator [Parafrankia sp. EUN1f]|uniref:TetR/AcrR family transcriptional regulator n=1 Tax=Parafrankia sp. EUN1f TaxID=102897 RepID=UPI0001C46B83|nr:TetR/AcrR family transcriptional regulator [Parafrankia sp. EUN1f]EFC83109.1 transcriptional regulator, TetR family [Parafrankia sp. EUN1f]
MTRNRAAASARRVGSASSTTRNALLDSVQSMMVEQGYAAVSYRALAARANVAPSLVQYYFPTLDDLFLGLLRRNTETLLGNLADVADLDRPLRAVWRYANSRGGAVLLLEFMALANNREAVHTEIGLGGERIRQAQLQAVTRAWGRYGLEGEDLTPAALLFMMNAIPRMILLEETFGTHTGHADTVEIIERFLNRIEPEVEAAVEAGPGTGALD